MYAIVYKQKDKYENKKMCDTCQPRSRAQLYSRDYAIRKIQNGLKYPGGLESDSSDSSSSSGSSGSSRGRRRDRGRSSSSGSSRSSSSGSSRSSSSGSSRSSSSGSSSGTDCEDCKDNEFSPKDILARLHRMNGSAALSSKSQLKKVKNESKKTKSKTKALENDTKKATKQMKKDIENAKKAHKIEMENISNRKKAIELHSKLKSDKLLMAKQLKDLKKEHAEEQKKHRETGLSSEVQKMKAGKKKSKKEEKLKQQTPTQLQIENGDGNIESE